LGDDVDWQTLLSHHEGAVRHFEKQAAAVRAALARYPLGAEIMELIAAEERAREAVLLWRGRLIRRWRNSLDQTAPLRILKPDHTCDRIGPAQRVIDETGEQPITGIYPTCSVCGTPQVSPHASGRD
jgi:hypothetical protein